MAGSDDINLRILLEDGQYEIIRASKEEDYYILLDDPAHPDYSKGDKVTAREQEDGNLWVEAKKKELEIFIVDVSSLPSEEAEKISTIEAVERGLYRKAQSRELEE